MLLRKKTWEKWGFIYQNWFIRISFAKRPGLHRLRRYAQPASETPSEWRFAGGPIVARDGILAEKYEKWPYCHMCEKKKQYLEFYYFTDRSKVVLLLWILYVFVLSCVGYVFVRVCLYVLCGQLLGKGWPLGARLWCILSVCHFPIGILGQVWYLIVSIPDLCTLTYYVHVMTINLDFNTVKCSWKRGNWTCHRVS